MGQYIRTAIFAKAFYHQRRICMNERTRKRLTGRPGEPGGPRGPEDPAIPCDEMDTDEYLTITGDSKNC